MNTKFIFVTGGVVSGLGKGITAASLGRLLKARGLKVSIQKFDPYINVDPGTMSPYQHGEVFVTDDGAETDLDLGHYERFIDENLDHNSSVTAGGVYWSVLNKERRGEFLGGTVQVIPHITEEIKRRVLAAAKGSNSPDVVITEIGGTVGDIESLPFLESIRQIQWEVGKENCLYVHVTLMPYLSMSGELKTKPTQHSVKELRSLGIQPDLIVVRSEHPVEDSLKRKIALFCNVDPECVIENLDAPTLYDIPLMLEKEGLAKQTCRKLGLPDEHVDLADWLDVTRRVKDISGEVTIALVGKYVELHDAYLSVVESLAHGGIWNGVKVNIDWIQAEEITAQNYELLLAKADGILVPGGFGERGVEGMILAVQYARENKVPYLGICLGLQVAVIEFARHVLDFADANSSEISPRTTHPVIDLMEEQRKVTNVGGTMRLGKYDCRIVPNTFASKAYGEELVSERHRHRFELNNNYVEDLEKGGMRMAGLNPELGLVEIVEIPEHPWFVGAQFHPEFKSRPNRPHPLFRDLVAAASLYRSEQMSMNI